MPNDKVIARPSGPCCISGTIHEGEPKGYIEVVLDVETYIAVPAEPNGNIVMFFPDIHGHFNNSKLLMDGWAEAGYLVLGPDYFRGVRTAQLLR